MVDMKTYQHLHTKADGVEEREIQRVETVDANLELPPDEEFLLLLPSNIQGYGFHDKRWSMRHAQSRLRTKLLTGLQIRAYSILILTSNRVGTFDEAFKSRMQLAAQYPRLNRKGRYEIWLSFFNALKKAGVEFDTEEMIGKVALLAEHGLNGRQIRNTIKTARQLAKYRNQVFACEHLNSVINVTNEFEQYLLKTKGHTDDQFAAEQGIR